MIEYGEGKQRKNIITSLNYKYVELGAEAPWFQGLLVGVIIAIFSPLVVKLLWDRHVRPNLSIDTEVVVSRFHLNNTDGKKIEYYSNRVIVVNNGKTSARECKAFLLSENNMDRIAWLIPYKDAGYTNNLNAHDKEFLDVCAVSYDKSKRVATTERGYGEEERDARPLNSETKRLKLKVSAANTAPAEVEIYFVSEVKDDHILIKLHAIQKPSTAAKIKKWIYERGLRANRVDQRQGSTLENGEPKKQE